MKKKILLTGVAGFIGFSLTKALLDQGYKVVGIDNLNDYYDTELKYSRLKCLGIERIEAEKFLQPVSGSVYPALRFIRMDIRDKEAVFKLFAENRFDVVCHLAAQAGVRYSIDHPFAYIQSNIEGFAVMLEACRHHNIGHFVYASSSSVYGQNNKIPYSESDSVDQPVSLYAATKKSNELMAYTYSKLYRLPSTGVRFFTVYGPWGRPDMAPFLFMDAIAKGRAIKVFNRGNLERDFTYVDDIVRGVQLIIETPPAGETPYEIYNLGHSSPVKLMDFIKAIENVTGKPAHKIFSNMQPGDVYATCADMTKFQNKFGYKPQVSIEQGILLTYRWYKDFVLNA
ncbi:MAG: NAD-dependent epimerase/dehydratase family protein [Dysgonamonadaceae bacterium]|jgi:UDP-glucuronate 4-epimerase|nr:NAD-dependent epimerase/dehydratase family protein [Dysgonamonadaceae bacterium]